MRRTVSWFSSLVASVSVFLLSSAPALAQYEYDFDLVSDTGSDALGAGMSVFMIAIWCCVMIFSILNLVVWITSLIHCLQHAPEDQKTLWIILIAVVPIAAWVYFFTKRKQWSSNVAPRVESNKS